MIETKIQMRFADVDMLGHVNNVNQQHYFDLGKSDFFRRVLGMKPVWKSEGLIMVSTRTDYRGQIRMEDPIVVTTCVDRIGHKSFTLRQQIAKLEPSARRSWSHSISNVRNRSKSLPLGARSSLRLCTNNKDTARAKPLPYPTGIPGSAHFIPRKRSSLHSPGTES